MSYFEEYITKMEARREAEKRAQANAIIAKSLREKTHEEAVAALYGGLTFVRGVSDVLVSFQAEKSSMASV
ncbi:MAG: hypothetical protein IJV83_02625 [Clostridia bacterium]|nr:hypothetical protein [Clostridia bacterium]